MAPLNTGPFFGHPIFIAPNSQVSDVGASNFRAFGDSNLWPSAPMAGRIYSRAIENGFNRDEVTMYTLKTFGGIIILILLISSAFGINRCVEERRKHTLATATNTTSTVPNNTQSNPRVRTSFRAGESINSSQTRSRTVDIEIQTPAADVAMQPPARSHRRNRDTVFQRTSTTVTQNVATPRVRSVRLQRLDRAQRLRRAGAIQLLPTTTASGNPQMLASESQAGSPVIPLAIYQPPENLGRFSFEDPSEFDDTLPPPTYAQHRSDGLAVDGPPEEDPPAYISHPESAPTNELNRVVTYYSRETAIAGQSLYLEE